MHCVFFVGSHRDRDSTGGVEQCRQPTQKPQETRATRPPKRWRETFDTDVVNLEAKAAVRLLSGGHASPFEQPWTFADCQAIYRFR